MNTNNKEAIESLRKARDVFQVGTATWAVVNNAINALQDNEDTEVEDIDVKENTCLCKEDNCPNCEYVGCKHVKPSSKVEKLKAIKERLQLMDSPRPEVLYLRDEVIRITNVLLEEEY